ncbi:MAG: PLP-dependent aminotransferase family protein [Oscillospiraceae bacterium]|nr:PLP-dependent aminotransferase family protein [Oscillospiraceae bacterium]
MEYVLSDRIASVKPSAIREIFKLAADPRVIAFSAGNPAKEAFPVEAVRKWTADILENDPIGALQYSVNDGDPRLRTRLKEFLKEKYNVGTEDDDIIITTGAEAGLDMITKLLCNEGDKILCEAPSFVGALNTFRSYRTELVGVEMEQDGIDLQKLEETLRQHDNIKFMYLIPNFQNPSGITMSFEKRKAVLALSVKYNVPIVEDNPYGDLRFVGEAVPAIKSMDTTGNVIYVGSFSKVLSPGLRVGYLCAPKALMPKLTVAKQCTDVHTPILNQMICYKFLTEFDFDAHVARCSEIYKHKCGLMIEGIERHFSKKVQFTRPEGGLFLWCTLPEGADLQGFCKEAINRGVAVVPGNAFLMNDSDPSTSFRLNYSTLPDEKIVKGIELLGELTREWFD